MYHSSMAGGDGTFSGYQGRSVEHTRRQRTGWIRTACLKYAPAGIVCALFLVLAASGWAIGTKAGVVPLGGLSLAQPGSSATPDPAYARGRFVYELPDGVKCRYVPFDNFTGWIGDDFTKLCEDALDPGPALPTYRKLNWSQH